MPDVKARDLLDRWGSLKNTREQHEDAWDDNGILFQPFRGEVDTSNFGSEGDQRVLSVFDGTGMRAAARFSAFIGSSLFPGNEPWLAFRTDFRLMEDLDVRDALDRTAFRVLEALSESNFYGTAAQAIRDLVTYGNSCFLVQEDSPLVPDASGNSFGGLLTTAIPMWRAWWQLGVGGRVTMNVRQLRIPAADAYRWFDGAPGETAMDELTKTDGKPMKEIDYLHFVLPNENAIPNGLNFREKAWVSVWVDEGSEAIVRTGGFDRNPYVSTRWAVVDGDDYGMSPAHIARPDQLTLNEMTAQEIDAVGRDLNPDLVVADDQQLDLYSMGQGYLVLRRAANFQPYHLQSNSNIAVSQAVREQLMDSVKRTFFADSLEPQDTQPRSAEESRRLRDLARAANSEAAQRIEGELLSPAVMIMVHLMERAGALPELTALGRALGGNIRLRPAFDNPFFRAAKAGRAEEVSAYIDQRILRATNMQDPAQLDDLNFDALNRHEAELLGLPGRIFREEAEVEELRAARAQRAAQERQAAAIEQITNVRESEARTAAASAPQQQAVAVA